jgi:hypothetical protein
MQNPLLSVPKRPAFLKIYYRNPMIVAWRRGERDTDPVQRNSSGGMPVYPLSLYVEKRITQRIQILREKQKQVQ